MAFPSIAADILIVEMAISIFIIFVVLFGCWSGKIVGLSSKRPPKSKHDSTAQSPAAKITRATQKNTQNNRERTVVLLYNKPANVVTSHLAEDSRSTVYEQVQSMKGHNMDLTNDTSAVSFENFTGIRSKLHAIGRLDADTTGLLLLTNDGGLVHHVTNRNAPTHAASQDGITKTYEALVMGHHDKESLSPLWEGVDIGAKYGGMTRPVDDLLILDHPNYKSTLVSLTISEGKNRQVRRMFHSIGSGVMKLKRTNVGTKLNLEGVDEDKWRILSDKEVRDCLGWVPQNLDEARSSVAKVKQFSRHRALPPKSNHRRSKRR